VIREKSEVAGSVGAWRGEIRDRNFWELLGGKKNIPSQPESLRRKSAKVEQIQHTETWEKEAGLIVQRTCS